MEILKDVASVAIIVVLVLGLNWMLRRAGVAGT
jgi:hypothetical protein